MKMTLGVLIARVELLSIPQIQPLQPLLEYSLQLTVAEQTQVLELMNIMDIALSKYLR